VGSSEDLSVAGFINQWIKAGFRVSGVFSLAEVDY